MSRNASLVVPLVLGLLAAGSPVRTLRAQEPPAGETAPVHSGDPAAVGSADVAALGTRVDPEDLEVALRDGDFAKLDALVEAARRAGRYPGDWRTSLDDALAVLENPRAGLDALDAWCARSSRSPIPFVARGRLYIHHAWAARGTDWAEKVSEEQWKKFFDRLKLARADLEKATRLEPRCAPAWAALVTVAQGLDLPDETSDAWFRKAVAADPRDLTAYLARLNRLMPKWGGTWPDLFDFARDQATRHPDEPALALLVVEAHLEAAERVDDGKAYLTDPPVRNELLQALKRMTDAYPRSKHAWLMGSLVCSKLEEPRLFLGAHVGLVLNTFTPAEQVAEAMGTRHDAQVGAQTVGAAIAFRFLEAAGNAGNLDGQYEAGRCLEQGWGVPASNIHGAIGWYERAASGGDVRAQLRLGILYRNGDHDLLADPDKAREWLEKAAAQGNDEAEDLLKPTK